VSLHYLAKCQTSHLNRQRHWLTVWSTLIEPDMWPPNWPDLSLFSYAFWGALQKMVYQRRQFTTINQLKQAIVTEYGKQPQRLVDRTIGHWQLECVVQQQGGHIERLMWKLRDVAVIPQTITETMNTLFHVVSFVQRAFIVIVLFSIVAFKTLIFY